MAHEPGNDVEGALAERASRMLSGTARFQAPANLEAQVWNVIERGANVPWWKQRVAEWPLLAQFAFVVTGVVAAAALMLGRFATPSRFAAAHLHTTLDVIAVFHRLTDTVAGSLPDGVWYGGIALCALAYVALFFLIVFGYRLLQAPAASR